MRFNLFQNRDTQNDTSILQFSLSYFIILSILWTISIIINTMFWVLPLFWIFILPRFNNIIKNFYENNIKPVGV